jgi:hypothetical protein
MNTAMQNCIEACQSCHRTCLEMATSHCLEMGGKHAEPSHLRLMLDCAQICQTTANFMLAQSEFHTALCVVCADICEACAISCEEIGEMDECVKACRECMHECLSLSGISVRPTQSMQGSPVHI